MNMRYLIICIYLLVSVDSFAEAPKLLVQEGLGIPNLVELGMHYADIESNYTGKVRVEGLYSKGSLYAFKGALPEIGVEFKSEESGRIYNIRIRKVGKPVVSFPSGPIDVLPFKGVTKAGLSLSEDCITREQVVSVYGELSILDSLDYKLREEVGQNFSYSFAPGDEILSYVDHGIVFHFFSNCLELVNIQAVGQRP